jgi:glycosyltransferase involved in cell wall biosynthesis
MPAPIIHILLAVYNGTAYLPRFLASLEVQSRQDFIIIARDDGSRDGSLALLRAWSERFPGRMHVIEDGERSGSAQANFGRLLKASAADYCLFADQDDLWHPEKVAATIAALEQAESVYSRETPLLAFCDLRVVNAEGTAISPSFRAYQGMDAVRGTAFHRLLLDNVITGCAMGVNASLRRLAGTPPDQAIMHDWWLALIAAAMGRIIAMPETLIDYRQHQSNAVGAVRWSARRALLSKWRQARAKGQGLRANQDAYAIWMQRLYDQAHAFSDRYERDLPADARAKLAAFLRLPEQGSLARRISLLRHGFRRHGLLRTLALYLRIG